MRYQALCRINFHGESKSQRDLALGMELVMGQVSSVAYMSGPSQWAVRLLLNSLMV